MAHGDRHQLSTFSEGGELMVTMSTQQHNLKVPISNSVLHGCFTLIMELFIPPKAFHISTRLLKYLIFSYAPV